MKKKMQVLIAVFALAMIFSFGMKAEAATGGVKMTSSGATSVTISWPASSDSYTTVTKYTIYNSNKVAIGSVSGNTTSVTITGLKKGYVDYYSIYYSGVKNYSSYSSEFNNYFLGSCYVNTTPATIAKSKFGVYSGSLSSKKVDFAVNRPADMTGCQIQVFKGKKRVFKDTFSVYSDYMKFAYGKVYKYRVRTYYTNSDQGRTYYGSWSEYRYFATPKVSAKHKIGSRKTKVTINKMSGIKYYRVATAKSSTSKFGKGKKTKGKGKRKVTITNKGCIKVTPYIKVGKKAVKSDLVTIIY